MPSQELDFIRNCSFNNQGFQGGDQYSRWQALMTSLGDPNASIRTATVINVPGGVYRFDQKLSADRPIDLRGAGSSGTVFLFPYSGGASIENTASGSKVRGIKMVFGGTADDGLSIAAKIGAGRTDQFAGVSSVPFPIWRPNLTWACGAIFAPATIPGWYSRLTGGPLPGVPNYGWAYQVTAANGKVARVCTISGNTFTSVSHGYADLMACAITSTNGMPGGTSIYDTFYVRDATANDFKLSATPGGAVFAIGSPGTGIITVRPLGLCGATEPTTWKTQNPRAGGGMPGGAGASYLAISSINTGTEVITFPSAVPWTNGTSVRLQTTGALPAVAGAALAALTNYFVGNVSGSTAKLYYDAALSSLVNFTGSGSGTHTVYSYTVIDVTTITDNTLTLTPVMFNGMEVKGSQTILEDVVCAKFPGNAFYYNTSSLYALDPSVLDGLPDYGNCSRWTMHRCQGVDVGASALFLDGYDASVGLNLGFDAHYVHGYGIFDHAGFTNTHDTAHADLCEAGTYWGFGAEFRNCYTEGDRSQPVILENTRWRGGICYMFSGCVGLADSANFTDLGVWEHNKVYGDHALVQPYVPNGWWYRIKLFTAGGTSTAGKTSTIAGASDTWAVTAHGYPVNTVVRIKTTGTMPGNFSTLTNYYVVTVVDVDHIKLSATQGGGAITAGSAGTGTHTMARDPVWKDCMDHALMDYRSPPAVAYDDTFKDVADGTLIWRSWISSELSTGMIDVTTRNTSANRSFKNRLSGEEFIAGGAISREGLFVMKAPVSTTEGAATDLEVIWRDVRAEYSWRRASSDSQMPFAVAGTGHAYASPGDGIATRGLWIKDRANANQCLHISVTAKPADSSMPYPCIAWHVDAVAGEPIGWKNKADLTWVTMPNYA